MDKDLGWDPEFGLKINLKGSSIEEKLMTGIRKEQRRETGEFW